MGGGGRSWVEVNKAECPTGQYRPDWLKKLRGYSRDVEWNVNNVNAHLRWSAIKEKMAAQFEY